MDMYGINGPNQTGGFWRSHTFPAFVLFSGVIAVLADLCFCDESSSQGWGEDLVGETWHLSMLTYGSVLVISPSFARLRELRLTLSQT